MVKPKFGVNKNFAAGLWNGVPAAAIIHSMTSDNVHPRLRQRGRVFIREWRKHRGLTLEQLSERIDMSPGNLSHLERGMVAYTQDTLEALAEALGTDAASLLMRDPTGPDAIWSVWECASAAEKQQIVELAKVVIKKAS